MQFNSETNNQDLISDITFRLGAGIDINNYTLKDRTRNINTRLGMVWQIIFESYGGWKFMDDNQSDASTGLPYADQTITSGTGLYAIPSAALTIEGVELKQSSASPLQRLIATTQEEFLSQGGDAAYPSNAVPLRYFPQGDVIRLLPVPNYTLSSGLRVFFSKTMTNFTTSDTTATPGFASIFHPMLSIGAAIDYAVSRLPAKVSNLQGQWNEMETRLRSFYAKRYLDRTPVRIGPAADLLEEYS